MKSNGTIGDKIDEIVRNFGYKTLFEAALDAKLATGDSKQLTVKCPLHSDEHASLSLNLDSGKFKCHGCGEFGDVFDLMQKTMGTTLNTIIDKCYAMMTESKPCVDQHQSDSNAIRYEYTDADGRLLFRVCRDSEKKFWCEHYDEVDSTWKLGRGAHDVILYNLRSVIAGKDIFICEGEKDVDNLARLGLAATTNPNGASNWKSEFSEYLKGKNVVILPDNDDPGRRHAQQVAKSLHGKAASIKIVELAGLAEKGDVSDWLAAGGTRDALVELAGQFPFWEPAADEVDASVSESAEPEITIMSMDDILRLDIPYEPLIHGLLGKEESLLLCGTSGIGKSALTLNLALELGKTDPDKLFGLFPVRAPIRSLFIQSENPLYAIQQRMRLMTQEQPFLEDSAGSVIFPRVRNHVTMAGDLRNCSFQETLVRLIEKADAQLIVVDPLISFIACSENENGDMRQTLDGLSRVMAKTGVSAIVVHHTGKNPNGSAQGGRGAQAISDWAANILRMDEAKDGLIKVEHQKARNYAIKMKTFYLRRSDCLNYSLASGEHGEEEIAAKRNMVIEAIATLGGEAGKQTELIEKVCAMGSCSPSEAQRMIKSCVDAGMLEERVHGRSKSYHLSVESCESTTVQEESTIQ